ncbi:family 10 glycosylhydrolase [Acidobacteria bacterium AH-259-G07]|nr:family 10 glycosylhydrolase [Acidobacteria bacterium AH-259-G07]
MSRRSFLGALSLSPVVRPSGKTQPAQGGGGAGGPVAVARKKKRWVPLWCDRGGLINPSQPSDRKNVLAFVEKCAQHGVTHLIPWDGSRILVEAAREKQIEVQPYLAFNSHGGNRIGYAWSVHYSPTLGSTPVKKMLDRHRPIWSHPRTRLSLSDFAKEHPQFWARDREQSETLKPGQRLSLSLALPEVRAYEVERYLGLLGRSGGVGVQVEFVSVNQDEKGVDIYGYEAPMVRAFEDKQGRSPFTLPNDDTAWMQFRADYVTLALRKLRDRLNQENPGAVLTTTLIAREKEDYLKVFQDWPAWVDQRLVDEFYLWFRTTSDVKEVARYTRQAAEVIKGRCPLIAELSCYHVGSLQDPELLLEAARQAKANGADAVGIYRSHAVDQLDFWPILEQIGKM